MAGEIVLLLPMKTLICSFLLLLTGATVWAQDSRNPEQVRDYPEITYSAAQLEAMRQAIREHPYTRYYDRLVAEYQERMKANLKRYKVMARQMEKPQYSDTLYFGHKRKPKKRPVGKRKFCKECEIVH